MRWVVLTCHGGYNQKGKIIINLNCCTFQKGTNVNIQVIVWKQLICVRPNKMVSSREKNNLWSIYSVVELTIFGLFIKWTQKVGGISNVSPILAFCSSINNMSLQGDSCWRHCLHFFSFAYGFAYRNKHVGSELTPVN